MSYTENSISQMILDQQLLSAYRNEVVNAQIRSLLNPSSLNLLSSTGEAAPTLTDRYILEALMPSMTPEEQLLTRLELLKNTVRQSSPRFAPTVPSASVSVSDIIQALRNNNSLNSAMLLNNSRASFFSPESSLIHDEQVHLGSLLSSDFGSGLLPSNSQILSESIRNLASKILEEKRNQNLSMELLNALSAAPIGIASDDKQHSTSDALRLLQKRQAEANLPTKRAKKKQKKANQDTLRVNESNRLDAASSKHSNTVHEKKALKQAQKSDKDRAQGSATSVDYEDAKLLFDTFLTLASKDKAALKTTCSTISVDSEGSVLKYEDFASSSNLTRPEFWDTVPKILTISMAQMSIARMKPIGDTVQLSETSELGYAALCCTHCKGVVGFGSHFFKNLRKGNYIHRIVKHVQSDCTACPQRVRSPLQKHCKPINSDSLGITISKSSMTKAFFEHIWNQLCSAGFIDCNKPDTDTDIDSVSVSTGTSSDE
jgi:hypothetical protein